MKKKQPKLTPWFPADMRPAHVGVYETEPYPSSSDQGPDFQFFDGRVWGCVSMDPETAYEREHSAGNFQHPKWRGLAAKPKAVKP